MSHLNTFFFSSRRRHTRWPRDWSSDVCSSDLATTGVRGSLNKLGMSLGPGTAELEERREQFHARRAREQEQHAQETRAEQRRREAAEAARAERGLIQTNYLGTRTILVANPKGGSRKTTSTWMLGHTMGTIRGGAVVAWDANETMGTLSDRGMQDRHSSTVDRKSTRLNSSHVAISYAVFCLKKK